MTKEKVLRSRSFWKLRVHNNGIINKTTVCFFHLNRSLDPKRLDSIVFSFYVYNVSRRNICIEVYICTFIYTPPTYVNLWWWPCGCHISYTHTHIQINYFTNVRYNHYKNNKKFDWLSDYETVLIEILYFLTKKKTKFIESKIWS